MVKSDVMEGGEDAQFTVSLTDSLHFDNDTDIVLFITAYGKFDVPDEVTVTMTPQDSIVVATVPITRRYGFVPSGYVQAYFKGDSNYRLANKHIRIETVNWIGKLEVFAYPNPFNPSTTISYTLKEPSKITLQIYNRLGQFVRTLATDQYHGPGNYLVQWHGKDQNGRDVASGVYLYVLSSPTFGRHIGKIIFAK